MRISLILVLFVALVGCSSEEGGRPVLPGKVGPAGELLVVATDQQWKGPIGEAIREVVQRPYPVLPQVEAMYSIIQIEPLDFDKFWRPHRNVLLVEVADRVDTQDPTVKFYKERYSQSQVYIEAKGRSAEGVASTILERGEEMLSVLNNEEISRLKSNIKAFDNEVLNAELSEKYGFTLDVPRESQMVMDEEDFIWIQREMTRMKGGRNHDVKEGFFIYTYPYDTDSVFSMSWLIEKRNEVLREHVQGSTPNSYMTTSTALIPRYEEVTFKGQFASELRGLWRMENDFMGGPFYMLTFYDQQNERIITLDGYAYAPYFGKREYIREVEAVLKTFRLTNGKGGSASE